MENKKIITISEQLKNVLEEFKDYKVRFEEGKVFLEYEDAYEIVSVELTLNEHGNVVEADIIHADLDAEIITQESCHGCFYDDCSFYDEELNECKLSDDDIMKEIGEYVSARTLSTSTFEISRIIVERKCYIDFPHDHSYKGHQITIKKATNILFRDVMNLLDELLELYESAIEK